MAPSRSSNVNEDGVQLSAKKTIQSKTERVLQNKKHANELFDILAYLQSEKEKETICATNACSRIFSELMSRGDLHVGDVPEEEAQESEERSAEEKYQLFMRHRYNNCVELLLENISHEVYEVKESSVCAVMKLVAAEGKHPLQRLDWSELYLFPRQLLMALVKHLLSETEDMSQLISRFQEFLEMDDVRYYVMSSVRDITTKVMEKHKGAVHPVYQNNVFTLFSNINLPSQASEITHFLVTQDKKHEDWKPAKLKEQKRSYEQMWLVFLKYKLPVSLYKKILLILHESILPQMNDPTLMIDFLTAAYDIGGAISLLALNGLFVLIHQHNLEYPDFYKKLYSLLQPSVFHVKYKARFFHLADIFLSSTHLPIYLVAAFVKRLARLALTAPPTVLLMLLPFIYNLIRRHPSCRVLIHRPSAADEPIVDPYVMEEEDPALCRALESSLWEIQSLQKHYHPDVSKAAMMINQPLPVQEEDLSELLELSTLKLMERDMKGQHKGVALEFDSAPELLKSSRDVLGLHFCLE